MPFIEIKNLKVTYYNDQVIITALNDVNVTFSNEKITAIIGPSGCGKTTLLRTICGFLDYQGEIIVDGKDYSQIDFKNRNISYIDQSATLNPNLDVYNNIAFPLIISKTNRQEIDQRIKKITNELGIRKCLSLFPSQLSNGQRQLALLAKALIKRPSLLLFDEAFSSVDPESKKLFIELIKKTRNDDPLTMLFVTHDYDEIIELADFVVTMKEGRIKEVIDKNDKKFNSLNVMIESNNY